MANVSLQNRAGFFPPSVADLFAASDGARTAYWSEFVEFVRRSPHGRRRVDTLSILDAFQDEKKDTGPIPKVDLSSLAGLAVTIPQLGYIKLAYVKLRVTASEAPLLQFPATLEKFVFDAHGADNEYTMAEFAGTLLRSLGRIKTLEFSNCVFILEPQYHSSNISLPHFSNLSTLVLRDNSGMGYVLEDLAFLARDGHLPVLGEVSLGTLSPSDIYWLNPFLVFMNVHLRILTLKLGLEDHAADDCAYPEHIRRFHHSNTHSNRCSSELEALPKPHSSLFYSQP